MIARTWRGRAATEKAPAYVRHFTKSVVPDLQSLAGHRGAWLRRRDFDGMTEFLAVTLWESSEAIKAFAGDDIAKAHVEPQARAVLSSFDDFADHYDVVASAAP